jgi:hypothetical protein
MKIIVLTPIKNEEWILRQFLTVTSLFADSIIIADQQSTDQSKRICAEFSKVCVIENPNKAYDEQSRQKLLIGTAREMFPGQKRILLCLDADEIISADSLNHQKTWDKIKGLEPGSSIYFEKPEILAGIKRCVRWKTNYFPIGYVDDGLEHIATTIHSKRIPENPNGEKCNIDDIKILHFAHSRKNAQSAKLRYYSVIENINSTKPFYLRRFAYQSFYNEVSNYPKENIEEIPLQWLKAWDEKDINFRNLSDPEFSWHDFEVLKIFNKVDCTSFYWDDIWAFDWEKTRQYALAKHEGVPETLINGPGFFLKQTARFFDILYKSYRFLFKR